LSRSLHNAPIEAIRVTVGDRHFVYSWNSAADTLVAETVEEDPGETLLPTPL
jgi:hypothetical protein